MQKFNFLSEETKKKYLDEIIGFFQDERGEEIGIIAAEVVLDFFLEKFSKEIYKAGVEDAKNLFHEKFGDIDVELDLLSEN